MTSNSETRSDESSPPALVISNLSKSYSGNPALGNINLKVKRGELFGLIGPDGAGKTTLMRIILGLLTPDSGKVEIFGKNPFQHSQQVKELTGYMPQRFSLYPDLTILENIRFFADLYLVPQDEREKKERELLDFSRLTAFSSRHAGKLSGGMKQKLALACTLIHTPRLIILDEPTTGVDPVSRREFWNILHNLKSTGTTLLVSTPYMDEASLCDRVALMHNGRFISMDTPSAICNLFTKELVEIRCDSLDNTRRKLLESGFQKSNLHRYGNALHLTINNASERSLLELYIKNNPIELRPIHPTIEDAFVDLISRSPESHAAN